MRGIAALNVMAAGQPIAVGVEKFLFLRHGETDGNLRGIYQRPEQPLNATGEMQAVRAAQVLARVRIHSVVASPMARAWRTASIVAVPHRLEPRAIADLQERLDGGLIGTPNDGFDWAADPPDCEPLAAFVERARKGLAAQLAEPRADDAGEQLIVAHGGVLLVLAASLGAALGPGLRSNARPLRFARRATGWTAVPLD